MLDTMMTKFYCLIKQPIHQNQVHFLAIDFIYQNNEFPFFKSFTTNFDQAHKFESIREIQKLIGNRQDFYIYSFDTHLNISVMDSVTTISSEYKS
ncbi:hypothetical protein D7V21_03860 [Acinetobacter guerrae]|uniref:Uncharacterized protein n=1 Tax=Acinetobacter guerrae TaxID=1843371 RepID=A0A3A8EKK2_9GAMM|nr:hypothetical protein D7V21_03860 [Acinetobacter guerrae]